MLASTCDVRDDMHIHIITANEFSLKWTDIGSPMNRLIGEPVKPARR
jgi:hypothetical protein